VARRGLSIRNQLLLVILVIIIGLMSQSYVSTITQQNLNVIQDQRLEYTNRDRELLVSINELQSNSQELVQTRLEQLVTALLVEDINFPSVLISTFRDKLSELISDFETREEIGYSIDQAKLVEIPGIYSIDADIISSIDSIVKTSTGSVVLRLQSIQDDINSVISDVLTKADDAQGDYEAASLEYYNTSVQISSLITTLQISIDDIATILNADPNDAYVQSVQSLLLDFTGSLLEFSQNWNIVQRDWVSLLENNTVSLSDSVEVFTTSSTTIVSSLSSTMTNLNNLQMNSSEANIVDTMSTTLNDQLIPAINSVGVNMNQLLSIRESILNYTQSNYVQGFQSAELELSFAKTNLNTETDAFTTNYNQLEASFRDQSRTVLLGITALLGVIILLIVLPVILSLRGSLGRLQKNFKEVAQGNLAIRKRKSYPGNELGDVEIEFDHLVDNLRNVVKLVRTSSEDMAQISEELAAGTEEASASIGEVSQTISSMASGATHQNVMLNQIDTQLRNLQRSIARVSSQINEASLFVLKMAQRTNILGLNASISAAKAGKYGKGFAVVANEIRDLSISSKQSAENITELIDQINFQIREAVDQLNKDIRRIREVAEDTASGSGMSTSSMGDQVYMIQEISQSSNVLADIAQRLNEQLKEFKLPQ
jgi:methyl-accepting chemotaxis protein